MIHVSDIENDLVNNDTRGLRSALRALVGYPKEERIEGGMSPDHLGNLLQRVAENLQDDETILPNGTSEAIEEAIGVWASGRVDYGMAARVVLKEPQRWYAIFSRHVGGANQEQSK